MSTKLGAIHKSYTRLPNDNESPPVISSLRQPKLGPMNLARRTQTAEDYLNQLWRVTDRNMRQIAEAIPKVAEVIDKSQA